MYAHLNINNNFKKALEREYPGTSDLPWDSLY